MDTDRDERKLAPQRSFWHHAVAVLVYDNRRAPRSSGARSVTVEHPRLLYKAGQIEIDLEVTPSQIIGRVRLLGQVTADAPNLAHAWVIAEGASGRLESEVDDLGQFMIDGLVSGRHRMEIGLAYELIAIPSILI